MNQELVKVERGHVVLRVPKYDVQRYIDQGYNEVDADGNIIQASVPRDLGTLQKAYVDHLAKIKELEDELEQLKKVKRQQKRKTEAVSK